MSQLYKCDRCGAHVSKYDDMIVVIMDMETATGIRFDLCRECYPELVEWFKKEE